MEAQPTEKKKIFDIIKSNLKIIITAIFLLLVMVSVYSWLKFKEDVKKTNLSQNYIEAKIMLSQKKPNEALDVLKKIIKEKDSTYSVLSLYLIIDQDLEKNEKEYIVKLPNIWESLLVKLATFSVCCTHMRSARQRESELG